MSMRGHKIETDPERAPDDPKAAIESHLRRSLRAEETLRIKSRMIAKNLGLNTSHVGTILRQWLDDPPAGIDVNSWGEPGTGRDTVWVISG